MNQKTCQDRWEVRKLRGGRCLIMRDDGSYERVGSTGVLPSWYAPWAEELITPDVEPIDNHRDALQDLFAEILAAHQEAGRPRSIKDLIDFTKTYRPNYLTYSLAWYREVKRCQTCYKPRILELLRHAHCNDGN